MKANEGKGANQPLMWRGMTRFAMSSHSRKRKPHTVGFASRAPKFILVLSGYGHYPVAQLHVWRRDITSLYGAFYTHGPLLISNGYTWRSWRLWKWHTFYRPFLHILGWLRSGGTLRIHCIREKGIREIYDLPAGRTLSLSVVVGMRLGCVWFNVLLDLCSHILSFILLVTCLINSYA